MSDSPRRIVEAEDPRGTGLRPRREQLLVGEAQRREVEHLLGGIVGWIAGARRNLVVPLALDAKSLPRDIRRRHGCVRSGLRDDGAAVRIVDALNHEVRRHEGKARLVTKIWHGETWYEAVDDVFLCRGSRHGHEI